MLGSSGSHLYIRVVTHAWVQKNNGQQLFTRLYVCTNVRNCCPIEGVQLLPIYTCVAIVARLKKEAYVYMCFIRDVRLGLVAPGKCLKHIM
jgi:hypothetical protein